MSHTFWTLIIFIFIVMVCRQISIEGEAIESNKVSWPAMYIGDDWHVNEPFWIKHEKDGQLIRNPKYEGSYGMLNEEGQKLKKELGQL